MPPIRKQRQARSGDSSIDWHKIPLRLRTGVMCGISRLPGAGFVWRPARAWTLEGHDFWFVISGGGVLHWGRNHSLPLAPGNCVWLRPEMRPGLHYVVTSQEDLVLNYMHFDTLRSERGAPFMPHASRLPPRSLVPAHPKFFEELSAAIVRLTGRATSMSGGSVGEGDPALASLLLRSLLVAYVAEASRQEEGAAAGVGARHRALVARVLDDMRTDFRGISDMASLAARYGHERHYFSRIFRRVAGITPAHALIRARVDEACRLLLRSDLGIGEIAESLGYSSIYFFSRQFKEVTGHSPAVYRQRGG